MVVGGGPAGIEIARVAALRGHDVTLFEKGPRLGGQLLLAAKAPDKDKIEWLIETLSDGLASSSAAVKVGVDVTTRIIEEFAPDVLVLATGGEPLIPNIPGIDSGSVTTAWSVIDGRVPAAKRFVVIGGSSTGCETAILLASLSKDSDVVLIEQLSSLASDMEMNARQTIRRQIAEAPNIDSLVGWKVTSISPQGVVAIGPSGESRVFEAEAIVLAAGVKPFAPLLDRLTAVTPPPSVYTVGDSSKPGTIASALFDARVLAAWI
jgi:NADPH-dependent 2,4-dienoyl-CoA reductase/sulfur reductase-like enzyme